MTAPDGFPEGVRMVERLDPDGQLHVRLAHEVDLDDLLLALAAEDGEYHFDELDRPTALGPIRGVEVGRFRCQFCRCGEHAYDIEAVREGQNQRGTYLGVMTS